MYKGQTHLSNQQGHLFVEGCDVNELAKEFGTPLFVVSKANIVETFNDMLASFEKHWPEGSIRVMPALKSNPNMAIRRLLNNLGAGCDVFGPGELYCAIQSGVPAELISLNGSIKNEAIITQAINYGCRIVIDSLQEIELINKVCNETGRKARVMLRLKPHLTSIENEQSDFYPELTINYLTQRIKYGMTHDEVEASLPIISANDNIELIGVHIHMGRHTKKLHIWEALMRHYVEYIAELSKALEGWVPQYIDFGGGIASSVDNEIKVEVTDYPTPNFDEYAKAITSSFRNEMTACGLSTEGLVLELEPGRALFNESGLHLTTVANIKHETKTIQNTWIELDTAETFLNIHDASFDPRFPFVPATRLNDEVNKKVDMVGQTCNAEMLWLDAPMPTLERGDIIALLSTGAYIEPMATNFNALPRPGMVLVDGNNAAWIKKPESIEQVFSRDVVPEGLLKL